METTKYQEIQLLALYWKYALKGECRLFRLGDGYKIIFPNGADVIQHEYSYGGKEGCVEFAGVDEEIDYRAIDFQTALNILKTFYDKLSQKA